MPAIWITPIVKSFYWEPSWVFPLAAQFMGCMRRWTIFPSVLTLPIFLLFILTYGDLVPEYAGIGRIMRRAEVICSLTFPIFTGLLATCPLEKRSFLKITTLSNLFSVQAINFTRTLPSRWIWELALVPK